MIVEARSASWHHPDHYLLNSHPLLLNKVVDLRYRVPHSRRPSGRFCKNHERIAALDYPGKMRHSLFRQLAFKPFLPLSLLSHLL